MRFQFIDRASIDRAFWSGIGDTYSGSLWFRRVANKSMLGNWVMWSTAFATSWFRHHSVEIGLFTLESLSARVLNFPGTCFTRSWILFWKHIIYSGFPRLLNRGLENESPLVFSDKPLLLCCLWRLTQWNSWLCEELPLVPLKWPSFPAYLCEAEIGFPSRLHETVVLPVPHVNPSPTGWRP